MTKPTTKDQMEWFINGVIALFEDLNGSIDEEKAMEFSVTKLDVGFKVDFSCISVDIPSSSDDPTKDDSHTEKYESYFNWWNNERIGKLVNYITEELERIHEITIECEKEEEWN